MASPSTAIATSILSDFSTRIVSALIQRQNTQLLSVTTPVLFTASDYANFRLPLLQSLYNSHTEWTTYFFYNTTLVAINTAFGSDLSATATSASNGFFTPTNSASSGTPTEPSSSTSSLPISTSSSRSNSSKAGNPPGLVAAVAVLAAIAVICLLLLGWMVYRQRRRGRAVVSTAYERKQDSNASHDPALQATVSDLQRQLEDQDRKLNDARAALVKSARSTGAGDTIDDRTLNSRFVQLSRHIQDLVFSQFTGGQGNFSLTPDLKRYMSNVNNYSELLHESKTRYLLIRSIIAQTLVDSWKSGELLSVSYARMNDLLSQGSASDLHTWRSQTAGLFKKSEAFRHEQGQAVENVTRRIVRALEGFDPEFKGENQLHQIVAAASELAMDLASQVSIFDMRFESIASTFSAIAMEDVLQETVNVSALEGRPVRLVVFPALLKFVSSSNTSQPIVIAKAQVYV
ncbi:MAG: hypothetical protein M1814_001459 [Vezdaea aestivalis]|nr:MAG: hypothetical protein M1814_001459 [Vezdaea aestivalis]